MVRKNLEKYFSIAPRINSLSCRQKRANRFKIKSVGSFFMGNKNIAIKEIPV